MKKISIFGKMIPVWLIILLVTAIPVSAALLQYYGKIITTVDVHQSIKLWDFKTKQWLQCTGSQGGGCTLYDEILEQSPGGERFCFKHKLINQMSVEGAVEFETVPEEIEGITTTIYKLPKKTILELTSKDPTTWEATQDMKATLIFDTVGNEGKFNYVLDYSGLQQETYYAIIYYADKPNRFVNWGGDNPGKLIDTFNSGAGTGSTSGNPDLNMNLPKEPDANIDEYDYCDDTDNYMHCHGAKIWIVPLKDYEEPALIAWNPSTYLFETDLITYFDCDLGVEDFLVDMADKEEVVGSLTIPSKEVEELLICYAFAENIMQGQYTITTNIKPVLGP